MKRIKTFALVAVLAAFAACSNNGQQKAAESKDGVYGEAFDAKNAIAANTLAGLVQENQEKPVTVTGKITEVCKMEGCWLNLDQGNGQTIRVDAKDHKYTVPKDCEGKTATVNGVAKVEVTSVDELKHFAKDEGKSQAEIDAITEPEKQLVIEATGIVIQ